jgi:2-polyprenyl-3-methyl-5-hydroxy-6-metoxy-1,4-benzoquinol methylase
MPFEPHEITWTPEKSKRIWDYYGSRSQFRSTFFGYIAGPLVARKLIAAVGAAPDARILDFSCGQGDVIAALLPHLTSGQEISACDFSATYVDAVQERFRGDARFKGAMLVTQLPGPLPAGHYDIVYATEVIEHLDDTELERMLAECQRILRPGGRVFFTTPNQEDYEASKLMCPECGCIFHKWQHLRTWTSSTLKARMEGAGFRTRRVEAVAWLNFRGKLMSLLTKRRIECDGLVYVGETAR